MKKIAIAGASGFVGKHLVRYLSSQKKYKILTSKRDLLNANNSDVFLSDVDILINLIGKFPPPFSDLIEKNVLILENLCASAAKNQVQKIIHVSAVAVYGSPKGDESFTEKNLLKPDTLYGLSKKMGEDVLDFYYRNYGLKHIIIRPPNVYGPGSDHGVIFNFIKSFKESGGVLIEGDGRQKRDYLFVEDLVRAITLSIESSYDNETFNVTSGEVYDLKEVIKLLEQIASKKIKINYKAAIKSSKNVSAKNGKVKRLLNWSVKTSFKDGLRNTFNSLK